MTPPPLVSRQPCVICLEIVSIFNPEFQWEYEEWFWTALNLVTSGKRGRGVSSRSDWPFHFRAWYNFYFDSCNIKLTFHGLLLFLFVFLLAFHIPLSSVEGKRTIFFGVIFSLASIFQLQIFAIPFPYGPIRSLLLPSFSSLHLFCIPPFCYSFSVTQTAGVTLLTLSAARPFYINWFLQGENSLPPGRVSLSFW